MLGREFTVVCPDLRGYGESSKPPDEPDHRQASKRAMARDAVGLKHALGYERFAVIGHDRGYVDGELTTGDPRAIQLTDQCEIAIVIGTPPAQIPKKANFSNA